MLRWHNDYCDDDDDYSANITRGRSLYRIASTVTLAGIFYYWTTGKGRLCMILLLGAFNELLNGRVGGEWVDMLKEQF